MKKILCATLLALFSLTAFAEELSCGDASMVETRLVRENGGMMALWLPHVLLQSQVAHETSAEPEKQAAFFEMLGRYTMLVVFDPEARYSREALLNNVLLRVDGSDEALRPVDETTLDPMLLMFWHMVKNTMQRTEAGNVEFILFPNADAAGNPLLTLSGSRSFEARIDDTSFAWQLPISCTAE